MTYIDFICEKLKYNEPRKPIYTKVIADELAAQFNLNKEKALPATSVAFKRIMDHNMIPELRFYHNGIYYKTKDTPFGELGINKGLLIYDKYIAGDIGYESGYSLLHGLGLTTQLPSKTFITTNKAKLYTRKDENLDVYICPPKTYITSKNKSYLQFLDAVELFFKAPVDAYRPLTVMSEYILKRNLNYQLLISYAYRYYNKNTLFDLAAIAGEGVVY